MKKIAILIPVYNGLKYLKRSVPCIVEQTEKIKEWQFQIIITDDNSTDGTSEWLSHNHPEILVLAGTGTLWWSGGLNMGVNYVLSGKEYQYILLWNHDTICAENYFETLIKKIPEYDTDTILASKVYFLHKPDVIYNMGAFFNHITGKRTLNGFGKTDSAEFEHPVQVDWTGGMGTLIPIEVFHKIGLFDEKNFPQYYGDVDFFIRAKENKYKVIIFPDLKMWNDKSSSGLLHQSKWHLFIRSLFSLKSNTNIIIEYRFLKKHCKSFLWFFYYLFNIAKYFAAFIKNWIKSLLN